MLQEHTHAESITNVGKDGDEFSSDEDMAFDLFTPEESNHDGDEDEHIGKIIILWQLN